MPVAREVSFVLRKFMLGLFLACSFGCLFYSLGFTMQYYGGVSSFRCLSAVNCDKEHLSKP